MKKNALMIAIFAAITGLSACSNAAKQDAEKDVVYLEQYVDSVNHLEPVYTESNWKAIDNGYQERWAKVENSMDKLDESMKAKAEASKVRYGQLKGTYEVKIKEAAMPDKKQLLRNALFGEGKIGNDMKFGFVTAGNIAGVYDNFVTTVSNNKDKYTREDWDEIKVLYEALDTRKNEVEKDLATKDNMKIAGLKIKFATIKAVERPFAKAKENEEAKEK